MSGTAWWDGRLVTLDDVRIPLDAAAMRYSQVVFDGCAAFRSDDGRSLRILDLDTHLARFRRSCDGLGLRLMYPSGDLADAVAQVARTCAPSEPVGLRLFAFSLDEGFAADRPASVCVYLRSLAGYAPDRPLRLTVASEPRPARTDLPRWLKATAHYAGARRAVLAGNRTGFDDVVFLNEAGRVTESSRASLLVIRADRLLAPPVTEGVLPGITRDLVATVARTELDLVAEQRPLTLDEVRTADGVVLCSSSLGAAVVGELDGAVLPVTGPAERLATAFTRAARGDSRTLDTVATVVPLAAPAQVGAR